MADVNVADRHLLGVLILFAFAVLTCLIGLRTGPSLSEREAVTALAARDAIQNERWLVPHRGGEPFALSAPLGVWAIAAASAIVQPSDEKPVNTWTARLPSALAAVACVMVVYWLGSMLFGHRTGLVAGFVAASSLGTIFFARSAQPDQLLTTLSVVALAAFWRGTFHAQPSRPHLALFYICFALSALAGGLLPMIVMGLTLLIFWFVTLPVMEAYERGPLPRSAGRRWTEAMFRRVRGLRNQWLLPGVLIVLLLAGAWPLYIYWHAPNALEGWRSEYFASYLGAGTQREPIWYYLPYILVLTFPFLVFVPESIASLFLPRYAAHRRGLGFAFTWAAVTIIFLSTLARKNPAHLLAAMPAFCLLLAPVVDRVFFGTLFARQRSMDVLCKVLPLLIGAVWAFGTWYGQREYPAVGRTLAMGLGAGAVVWIVSCLAYWAGLRRSSFGLFIGAIPFMLALVAPAIGKTGGAQREAEELSRRMREQGFHPKGEVFLVDGGPNAGLEFYADFSIRRLERVSPLSVGEGSSESPEFSQLVLAAIKETLGKPEPAYFIVPRSIYDRLVSSGEVSQRVYEVAEIEMPSKKPHVIVTQRAGGSQAEASTSPTSGP